MRTCFIMRLFFRLAIFRRFTPRPADEYMAEAEYVMAYAMMQRIRRY